MPAPTRPPEGVDGPRLWRGPFLPSGPPSPDAGFLGLGLASAPPYFSRSCRVESYFVASFSF